MPVELDTGEVPIRFWQKYVKKPTTASVPFAVQWKNIVAKERTGQKGSKWAQQFDNTHKLKVFYNGQELLVKANSNIDVT